VYTFVQPTIHAWWLAEGIISDFGASDPTNSALVRLPYLPNQN